MRRTYLTALFDRNASKTEEAAPAKSPQSVRRAEQVPEVSWRSMEELVLIVLLGLIVLLLMARGGRHLGRFVVNALIGIVLLFLTNLFITPPIPISILTVLICAIGGVLGWLIILILYALGIAFYVPG